MGICASCLGLSSGSADDDEHDETSNLINREDQAITYGTSDPPFEPLIPDIPPILAEEEEAPEQEVLSSVWKDISDKLIDISLLRDTQDTPTQPQKDTPDRDSAYGTQTSIDYERLFRDTLPRKTNNQPNRPAIQPDTFTPPKTPDTENKSPADEQQWLRSIITRDPQDKSWDPNRVQKIGKPLLVNFDDVLARDNNQNEKPSGGAKASKNGG